MQTQVLERDAGRTKLQIDIPASDVTKAYQQVLASIARQIRVPGFRPGKAPRGEIETLRETLEAVIAAREPQLRNAFAEVAASNDQLLHLKLFSCVRDFPNGSTFII